LIIIKLKNFISIKGRSEGIRRIVLIASVLSVIGSILFVAIASKGFDAKVTQMGWVIFFLGIFISYFVPIIIIKIIYWVIDGFRKDKIS
jgi:hypothetical protein